MGFNNIPAALKRGARFCCWRLEPDPKGAGPSCARKGRKIPYDPVTGRRAQPNKPETFTDYQTALQHVDKYTGLGLGIFGGISAIDIDHCVENGELSPMARDILDIMHSPAEYSPSGTGVHIYFRTENLAYDKAAYYINNQKNGLEVYISGSTHKYVTLTGNVLRDDELGYRTAEVAAVLEKYMRRGENQSSPMPPNRQTPHLSDDAVLRKARSASNGAAFNALWEGKIPAHQSHSEADASLCSHLAFWCGRDAAQMDRLFRRSGLYRPKWEEARGTSTYGQQLIQHVMERCDQVYTPPATSGDGGDSPELQRLSALQPHSNPRYTLADIGNGNLFADFYKDVARYVSERKCWHVYDGKVWQADIGGLQAMELCKQLARHLLGYAYRIEDDATREQFQKQVMGWRQRRCREIILKDAASVHPISMKHFDRDGELFNCLNGTLNLRNRSFHPHRPQDFLTKLSGVSYIPGAEFPRWNEFIGEVMSGDADKALFLQKALGYALTGDTRYEVLFILFGATTRNGKGTTMETFLRLMGEYGRTTRPETIGVKLNPNSNAPTEDIARLAGARFVNISEPDKKLTLSAALIKTLTGNDTVTARFLHENSFEYVPRYKLFINTNYLPQVNDLTIFSSGRIKIITFERHFEEGEQDKTLKSTFSKPENLSGILNWCLDGLTRLRREGLEVPSSVKAATEAYFHDSDKIGLFMEEMLAENPNTEVRTGVLYDAFQRWCEENGFHPENMRNFKALLAGRGQVVRKRPSAGGDKTTVLLGYALSSRLPPWQR